MLQLQGDTQILVEKKRRLEVSSDEHQTSKRQCSVEVSCQGTEMVAECVDLDKEQSIPHINAQESKSELAQELIALDAMSYQSTTVPDEATSPQNDSHREVTRIDAPQGEAIAISVVKEQSKRIVKGKKRSRKQQVVSFPMSPMALDRLLLIGELLLQGVDASWRRMIEKKLFSFEGLHLLHKYGEEISQQKRIILPPMSLVFEAFRLSKFEKTRVVILGQDPYHRPGQAMGLAFSVPRSLKKLPPSLKNIYAELGLSDVTHGDLTSWAAQGVLLLNPVLTVAEGQPNSHATLGWQRLTDEVIAALAKEGGKVFMLWGEKAKAKLSLINEESNLCLQSAHPSPLATKGDFKGCGHFRLCNKYLQSIGSPIIRWDSVRDI